jgi:hypothetical protein
MALQLSLKNCPFKINYGPQDDRVRDFDVPALSRSVSYERSFGFFSSTSLAIASRGVAHLIRNKGRMRLLVGAKLNEQDVKAIEKGHDLAGRVSQSMLSELENLEKFIQNKIQALTWMVAEKALEIKVVLPSRNGIPLSSSESHDYYHPKEALFTDSYGDQIGFNGSVNESCQGWENNYETFMIYRSWDDSAPYLKQIKYRFDYLWTGREKDWIALDIPTAVRQRLLDYAPSRPPEPEEEKPVEPTGSVTPEQRERIILQFLRDACPVMSRRIEFIPMFFQPRLFPQTQKPSRIVLYVPYGIEVELYSIFPIAHLSIFTSLLTPPVNEMLSSPSMM